MGKSAAIAAFLLLFMQGAAMADFLRGRDAFLQGHNLEAFRIFQIAAHTGDAKSQIGLGLMHTWGKGTTRNYIEAYRWFDRVATGSEPIHRVVRILARTNRDYLAKRMSAATLADAKTIAALSSMNDNAAPDTDLAVSTAVIRLTVLRAQFIPALQRDLTALATVE